MNQTLRTGLVIAGSLIIAVLALKLIARGGGELANTASRVERKL